MDQKLLPRYHIRDRGASSFLTSPNPPRCCSTRYSTTSDRCRIVPWRALGIAEHELVQAHAGLSKLAMALEASRTMRVQTLDLVVAVRELRRVKRPD